MEFVIKNNGALISVNDCAAFPRDACSEWGPYGFRDRETAIRFATDRGLDCTEIVEEYDDSRTSLPPIGYR
jgi:hypothetical protein